MVDEIVEHVVLLCLYRIFGCYELLDPAVGHKPVPGSQFFTGSLFRELLVLEYAAQPADQ